MAELRAVVVVFALAVPDLVAAARAALVRALGFGVTALCFAAAVFFAAVVLVFFAAAGFAAAVLPVAGFAAGFAALVRFAGPLVRVSLPAAGAFAGEVPRRGVAGGVPSVLTTPLFTTNSRNAQAAMKVR
ncbi:hypothetical protein GCM10023192_17930 [Amycolatopsis samaneae]